MVSLIRLQPDGTYVPKYYCPTQYANLLFQVSSLELDYTTSLLSSLNSCQGWGFDTSENNDGESVLSTDLGLGMRFASNFQSTFVVSSVNPFF